jgi:hypothetical protein
LVGAENVEPLLVARDDVDVIEVAVHESDGVRRFEPFDRLRGFAH